MKFVNKAVGPKDLCKEAHLVWPLRFTFKDPFALFLTDTGQHGFAEDNHGYGSCIRHIGRSYTNIIVYDSGDDLITSFDLHVVPPAGYEADEVFKIEVKRSSSNKSGVTFRTVTRQSIYSKFKDCVDKSVDIKLCACADRNRTRPEIKDYIVGLTKERMFGSAPPNIKDLHSGCLLLVTRSHGALSVSHEVANVCSDHKYTLTVRGYVYRIVLSRDIPLTLTVPPMSIHFILSAIRYATNDSIFNVNYEVELVE